MRGTEATKPAVAPIAVRRTRRSILNTFEKGQIGRVTYLNAWMRVFLSPKVSVPPRKHQAFDRMRTFCQPQNLCLD